MYFLKMSISRRVAVMGAGVLARAVAFVAAVLVVVMSLSGLLMAQPERFVEGVHYKKLAEPVPTQDVSKIEVVEVFSYLCPHCYDLEPALAVWRKKMPKDVVFVYKHAQFNESYKAYAKLHLLVQALGLEEKAHHRIFDSVHKNNKGKKLALTSSEQFALLEPLGVSQAAFDRNYNAIGMQSRFKQVGQDMIRYQITGVPAIIVNGKYHMSVSSAGSQAALMDLMDFLIDKERAGR